MSTTKPTAEQLEDLASVHTHSLTQILNQAGISLAVTTYQAGKLILARADGDVTNTHFRRFQKPMGMACDRGRMALGVAAQICEMHNVPAAAARLTPPGRHDACYLPRSIRVTGDVDVHEMAWRDDELWFINTRFSCLCTLDSRNSFVPRWRPPFISAYDMRDRCHLNGLGMREGKPRYVTALGQSDEPGGWRKNKADGGILMDLHGDRMILEGLSMPHSPRWYRDQLWVLESGRGSLLRVDPQTGAKTLIAELPGFTRGLDFFGDLAFIGLSQVRETAVFAGLPLTRTQPVRHSGVWVVNINTGQTVAFLRFEAGVREVFAVSVLPWRFPDLVHDDAQLQGSTYVLPDDALAEVVQPSVNWEFAENHFEEGNRHYNDGRVEQAIACYRKALELRPDLLPARFNLGVALSNQGDYPAAMAIMRQVIADEAGHVEAYNSLGFIHGRLAEFEQAEAAFAKAVEIRPDFAQARYNLGQLLLRRGEYQQGWEACEWLLHSVGIPGLQTDKPRWDGSMEKGKTLLLHAEQPADIVLFARFLPLAAERCERLLLQCPPSFQRLLAGQDGVDRCLAPGEIREREFDLHAPMASLPHLLQQTQAPAAVPSYLRAAAESPFTVDMESGSGPRVGFAWVDGLSAKPGPAETEMQDWHSVLSVEGVRWFLLQQPDLVIPNKAVTKTVDLIDLPTDINDMYGVSGLIKGLDLVVGVDGALVQLAAALGKPAWVLLDEVADWRYPREGQNTPWYEQMRLFRPQPEEQLAQVIERIATELRQLTPSN